MLDYSTERRGIHECSDQLGLPIFYLPMPSLACMSPRIELVVVAYLEFLTIHYNEGVGRMVRL